MAIPPILIVLIVSPINRNTTMATRIDKGMVTSEIRVVRAFIRKINRMITTKTAPSISDRRMLPIELSINRDCRKISVATCTSRGIVFCNSAMEASSFRVRSSVLVCGCFVTVSNTAGLARCDATPSFGIFAPIRTSATSPSKSGTSPTRFNTAFERASTSLVEITPRMMYSFPYSYNTPPDAF